MRTPRATLAGLLVAAGIAVAVFLTIGSKGGQIGGPLAQAATYSSAAAGYRIGMSVQLTSADLNSPVTEHARGVVDIRDGAMSMALAINLGDEPQAVQQLGARTLRMQIRTRRSAVYVKLPRLVTSALAHSRRPWLEMDLGSLSSLPGVSSLTGTSSSNDPTQVLQSLHAASDDILNEGRHRVGGVPTTEYFADLSVSRLADRLPPAQRHAAQPWITALRHALTGGMMPTRVWVDAHHLVRRVNMILAINLGGSSAVETITMTFSHYGPQKPPAAPPANRVTDITGLAAASPA